MASFSPQTGGTARLQAGHVACRVAVGRLLRYLQPALPEVRRWSGHVARGDAELVTELSFQHFMLRDEFRHV
jgi:hypothetical protein